LKVTDVTAFNLFSKDVEDVSSDKMKVLEEEIEQMKDEHSNGVERMFPFVPTCTFNGIEVPTFVTCSKNGSITSQLLTNMLQKNITLRSSTAVTESTPYSYVMATGVRSKNLSSSTPWNQTYIGLVALACHMEHPCGKLEIVRKKWNIQH
jgi:hypothetical protein